jgi:hypothetical protein
VDVLAATPGGQGLSGALQAGYVIKLTAPGPLQATAGASTPIDGTKLRDVVLTFGYHLTSA